MPTYTRRQLLLASAGVVLIIVLGIAAYFYHSYQVLHSSASETSQVRTTVSSFGDQLRNVPLVATPEIVAYAMDKYYSIYVRPDLLDKWKADPLNAPGRLTSSPYPNAIDIESIRKNADKTYTVEAFVVMVANGADGKTERTLEKVSFTLTQGPDGWQITEYHKMQ